MRLLLPTALLILTLPLAGCSTRQPGCTADNCRKMVEACRVELGGTPSARCFNVAPVPANFDFASYCVDACNAHRGSGVMIQCIADMATECVAARDAGRQAYEVINPCLGSDGGLLVLEKACEDRCYAARTACDDKCSGGSACNNCRMAGTANCSSVCPDAGFKECTDCSAGCGLTWIGCVDACPRQ